MCELPVEPEQDSEHKTTCLNTIQNASGDPDKSVDIIPSALSAESFNIDSSLPITFQESTQCPDNNQSSVVKQSDNFTGYASKPTLNSAGQSSCSGASSNKPYSNASVTMSSKKTPHASDGKQSSAGDKAGKSPTQPSSKIFLSPRSLAGSLSKSQLPKNTIRTNERVALDQQ